jgi:hypothetical protein
LRELANVVESSNLSEERIEAVQKAIQARNFSFEVDVSKTTGLGGIESERASILRTIADHAEAERQLGVLYRAVPMAGPEAADDRARVATLRSQLKQAFDAEPFDPARVERALQRILVGTRTFESAAEIAARYGVDVGTRRPVIRRETLDVEGADEPYVTQAKAADKEKRKAIARTAGFAIGVAEQVGLADRGYKRVPTTDAAPPDVAVVKSTETGRTLAVTRPPIVSAGSESESATSRHIVGLLQDGVALSDGRTRPDHLLWDATQADSTEALRVLDQVRTALETHSDDPSRLHVLLPASVAPDEASLRKLMPSSSRIQIVEIERPPHQGSAWLLSFDPPAPNAGK